MSRAHKPDMPDSSNSKPAHKANPAARIKRKGQDFGFEGTNKTVPVPQPESHPADELQGTRSKFIPKTPFTRG